jgi:hypothetical protein
LGQRAQRGEQGEQPCEEPRRVRAIRFGGFHAIRRSLSRAATIGVRVAPRNWTNPLFRVGYRCPAISPVLQRTIGNEDTACRPALAYLDHGHAQHHTHDKPLLRSAGPR